ncbi:exosortase family protein XrtF [Flavobacterium agrisoli]|uniref:Exosortase family protein XrtF n=1 Tax=Flavobacterium agrisoli TaxID=2793066 RepID=A0A934UKB9_9FLAO|nr:exosortase family protein XrtF [Flavobacterium agrisoli]MBK0370398.1 exosortase family protein XrtF [Flavobacterium agrisoli]
MRKYIQQYRPFLLFLGTFFLVYVVLTFLYQQYLSSFDDTKSDGITALVSQQVESVLQWAGFQVSVTPVLNEWYLTYQNTAVIRIVEGCNAVSVFILFVSFIAAFAGRFVNTFLFIIFGTAFIYLLNILRIAALSILLYRFPAYSHLLHGVLFPLVIYGTVFVLWFFWVTKYSKYAN